MTPLFNDGYEALITFSFTSNYENNFVSRFKLFNFLLIVIILAKMVLTKKGIIAVNIRVETIINLSK